MSRRLLVEGHKTFRITIPDEAKVTFGPWSPGEKQGGGYNENKGTLRVYENKSSGASILGVWSGVKSFRDDEALDFEERTVIEQGSTVWHSDKKGYKREEAVNRREMWGEDDEDLEIKELGVGSET